MLETSPKSRKVLDVALGVYDTATDKEFVELDNIVLGELIVLGKLVPLV